MTRLLAAALLALTACTTTAQVSSDVIRVHNDYGGSVRQYSNRVADAYQAGKRVRATGVVASAATFWLGLGPSNVCTTPQSRWLFHAAANRTTGRIDTLATYQMIAYYPTNLATWFMDNAADKVGGKNYAELSGAAMIENGWAVDCREWG